MTTDWVVSGHVNISAKIREDPQHAIAVLLETGALVPLSTSHCEYDDNGELHCQPVYRLADEESTDAT